MKKLATILSATVLALALVVPASAQTSTKTGGAKTPAKTAKVTSTVKTSKDMNKVTGTVTRDAITKGIVTIGVPKQGRVSVDASKAKIRTKDGKFFSLNKIAPGSNITAMGKMSGKSFMASSITVNYVPTSTKKMPSTAKPAKAVKVGNVSH